MSVKTTSNNTNNHTNNSTNNNTNNNTNKQQLQAGNTRKGIKKRSEKVRDY